MRTWTGRINVESTINVPRRATLWFMRLVLVACAVLGCGRTAPFSGEPATMTKRAMLPSPRHEPGVFTDGTFVYVLGGDATVPNGHTLDEVLRFDPRDDTVVVLPEHLPTRRA